MLLIILVGLHTSNSFAQHVRVTQEGQHPLRHKADRIHTVTTNFDGNLSGLDVDVQTALDSIDDLANGALGDVTSVGDCTSGACLDGTSDGGNEIELFNPGAGSSRFYFQNKTGSSDTYFEYNATNEQVHLYVQGSLEQSWPAVVTQSFLLLENGDFILLEDGGKIIID